MIARFKLTTNPHALIDYILSDKMDGGKKGRASVISMNYCFGAPTAIKNQFDMAIGDSRLKSPAMHIMVSLAPNEKLTEEQKHKLMHEISAKLGLEDYPFLFVEHNDTDSHSHFHLAICRKSLLDGKKTLSDSNIKYKLMEIMRKMELEFNLQKVEMPFKKERRFSDKRKAKMKADIIASLKNAKSYERFHWNMVAKGYQIQKGRGISFTDEKGMSCKGSDRQIGFSLQRISKIIEANNVQEKHSFESTLQQKSNKQNGKDVPLPTFQTDLLDEMIASTRSQPGTEEEMEPYIEPKRRKFRRRF